MTHDTDLRPPVPTASPPRTPHAPGRTPRTPTPVTPLRFTLPDQLRYADSRRLTCAAPLLLPGETETVARTRPARRRAFLAGRACAREALHALGVAEAHRTPLPRGPAGAPVWPPGVTGSIAHCGGFSTAAVARRDHFAGLGIAVAPSCAPVRREDRYAFTRRERDWLRGRAGDGEPWAAVIRSAKTSLYKALTPEDARGLGPLDASVLPDAEDGTLRIRWEHGSLNVVLAGRFAIGRHHLAACVTRAARPEAAHAAGPTRAQALTAARADSSPPLALLHTIGWI
ncbi:4'-phosphopantetheinyl transferase family protein [Streptomyces indicus]|uniref:4'-phosphopantetheinyl transferase EntD (Siderophore biosynthesis) n=1 Tax=Streptomyces indicus TaxID=417292 RepID=A0A1G9AWU0_9ACTN|nr:hypothetical protein [Streptomyces indicus]SDK31344.1 4'-phosphopantetheinyl transferase EntD (siderophore biosynthesis) [Streptomyces indicus]